MQLGRDLRLQTLRRTIRELPVQIAWPSAVQSLKSPAQLERSLRLKVSRQTMQEMQVRAGPPAALRRILWPFVGLVFQQIVACTIEAADDRRENLPHLLQVV